MHKINRMACVDAESGQLGQRPLPPSCHHFVTFQMRSSLEPGQRILSIQSRLSCASMQISLTPTSRARVSPLPRWHAAAESGILCAIINETERREGL